MLIWVITDKSWNRYFFEPNNFDALVDYINDSKTVLLKLKQYGVAIPKRGLELKIKKVGGELKKEIEEHKKRLVKISSWTGKGEQNFLDSKSY